MTADARSTARTTSRAGIRTQAAPSDARSVAPSGRGRELRALLAGPGILELPSVCDSLGARMARDAGFRAASLEGYAIGSHLPLGRALSLADLCLATSAVVRACAVPLLVDADAGWDAVAVLVARLEDAGVAAIQLSSQHLPERVPYSDATERRLARQDLVQRVRAGVAARTDCLITARCDVDADGYRVAVEHARALRDAGADALAVHSASEDDLSRWPRELPDTPLVYVGDARAPRERSTFDLERLREWGYRGVRNKYHRCYCARMTSCLSAEQASPVC